MSTQPAAKAVHKQPIYLVNFEEYLKPKQPHKLTSLQYFEKPKPPPPTKLQKVSKCLKRLKILRWLRQGRRRLRKGFKHLQKRFADVPLPSFLAFLRARVDDGMCKRKTGFEIYCEMASIHGFHIFVGAKTWQRVLWWLLICTAVLLSMIILIMSHMLNEATPTMRYVESMTQPTSSMPFPAISVCSLNRVSKQRLKQQAKELELKESELRLLVWKNQAKDTEWLHDRNLSWTKLLASIAPPLCDDQLLGCKWQGSMEHCQALWQPIWTSSYGLCCTFNYQTVRYTYHSGAAKGLTVRLATQREDYGSSAAPAYGFYVLVHDSSSGPDGSGSQVALVGSGSEARLMIKPFGTHATSYLSGLDVDKRRCYLPNERELFNFSFYTQENCLAECRSERLHQRCGCVAPHAPKKLSSWPLCQGTRELQCLRTHDFLNWQLTEEREKKPHQADDEEEDQQVEQHKFICNCWPLCQFNRYELQIEAAPMENVNYPLENDVEGIFDGFNASEEVLLHVYFDALTAEQLRLDVYENWLTFIGTFGGITGLFMGCSFVSVFELIFFVFVRPACNWLTRKQLHYRQRRKRRRQLQAAAHAVATMAAATAAFSPSHANAH